MVLIEGKRHFIRVQALSLPTKIIMKMNALAMEPLMQKTSFIIDSPPLFNLLNTTLDRVKELLRFNKLFEWEGADVK